MRRFSRSFVLAPALALSFVGVATQVSPFAAASPAAHTRAPRSATAPLTVASLVRGNNAFGFDLYRRLRTRPGNLVLSPLSLSSSLVMTWGGARGETAEQMRRVLHIETGGPGLVTAWGELVRIVGGLGRQASLVLANRLFGEESYPFDSHFREKTEAAFDAPVELLDFRRQAEPSRRRINAWVEERTAGRIRNLVPAQSLGADTRLVLVNAIYFLGAWEHPFDAGRTAAAPFHRPTGTPRSVPTMHRFGRYRIAELRDLKVLEIPYEMEELSLLILLPATVKGLPALEAGLDSRRLEGLLAALREENVDVALPKISLNPPASIPLGNELIALGMPLAFDPSRADFSGITGATKSRDRLCLGKVFHQGSVRIDEAGTEAAAASSMEAIWTGASMARPHTFHADHPFLLVIRDTATGLIVFLGRVENPSAG